MGEKNNVMYNNPLVRFNQDLATYAHDHSTIDDVKLSKTDNFERLKQMQAENEKRQHLEY